MILSVQVIFQLNSDYCTNMSQGACTVGQYQWTLNAHKLPAAASKHTHAQCSTTNVGLAQACPNNHYTFDYPFLA